MSAVADPYTCEVVRVAPGEWWVNVWARATRYLQAGAASVIVVDPDRRTAMLCRPDVPPVVVSPTMFDGFRAALHSALD